MPATCGMPLTKIGIFIGIIYLIHSILCFIYTTIKLCNYMQEKKRAAAEGLPFIEDKETISVLASLLSLSLTSVMTSALLIWGSIKRNYLYLIPFLFYGAIMILLTGIYLFALVYKLILSDTNSNIEDSIVKILILMLALILQIIIYKTIKLLQNELIIVRQLAQLESGSATIYIIQHEEPPDRR